MKNFARTMKEKNPSSGIFGIVTALVLAVAFLAAPVSALADGTDWSYYDGGYDDWSYSAPDYGSDWSYYDGGYDQGYDSDWSYYDGGYDEWTYDEWTYDEWSYDEWTYDEWSYDEYYYDEWSYDEYYYDDYYYDYDYHYVYDDYYYRAPTYSYNPPRNPPRERAPDCTLEVSDTSIEKGDTVTISWTADDADEATLTSFGSVNPRSGSERVQVNRSTTFVLRVEGDGGSKSCSVPVHVDEEEEEDLQCDITASDKTIDEDDEVTLRWTSRGADEARINQGIGSVSRSGSEEVSPNRTTTYVLTVENDRGDEEDCSVTIKVEEEDEDDDLWCEITASPRSIEDGESTTLRFDIEGADDARINQGVGSVDEDGGTERVRPTRDTRYTLTVENDDGDEEDCSVTIDVEDGLAPPPDVPLVYLSQLPYTGAEDTMTYWLLLIIGSGAVGYFLFFRALPFAMARVKTMKSDTTPSEAPVGEGTTLPQNVTRQDVRAFVSALAENDSASAREFARAGGEVLFSETAVVLDDVMRGVTPDAQIASLTKNWDASKFTKLITAFADASDADTTVDEVLKD